MSLFILKIIGIISMFIDHYDYIIGLPKSVEVLGRIAFPIFAFAISEGYKHTRNLKNYILRIGIFAVLLQIPSWIFSYNYPLNIFFTLFTGLCLISVLKNKNVNDVVKIIFTIMIFFITRKINLDYGLYGFFTILIFTFYRENKVKMIINFVILNVINIVKPNVFNLDFTQIYSLLALIPIILYNGERGKNWKYFFYLFYPLHFLVIEGIKKIFNL